MAGKPFYKKNIKRNCLYSQVKVRKSALEWPLFVVNRRTDNVMTWKLMKSSEIYKIDIIFEEGKMLLDFHVYNQQIIVVTWADIYAYVGETISFILQASGNISPSNTFNVKRDELKKDSDRFNVYCRWGSRAISC